VPIVYIHGVAVRDEDEVLARAIRQFGEIPWTTIEQHLRTHVAPAISDDPGGVPVMRAYWGDLGARFAWGGRSLVSRPEDLRDNAADVVDEAAQRLADDPSETGDTGETGGTGGTGGKPGLRERGARRLRSTATAIRRPLEDFVPIFIGDVMTYVVGRGTSDAPGPIITRVLDQLDAAAFAAASRQEPLVVLTHSMGGQIVYDLVTHFLPRMPEHRGIRIDYWCAAASQVGLFEELGLFIESDPTCGAETGRMAQHPPRDHLGGWWNVWDHADLLSFRAAGIIEGVDDSPFFASGSLATDHYRYLANPDFYRALAERVSASLEEDR
jgi:hypothetical protein